MIDNLPFRIDFIGYYKGFLRGNRILLYVIGSKRYSDILEDHTLG